LTFEDLIVQKEPAPPVYPEHSFVTWRSPLRGDADNEAATAGRVVPTLPGAVAAKLDTVALALGLVVTPRPSAHPTAASAPAQRQTITTNFIDASFGVTTVFPATPNPTHRHP